MLTVTEAHVRSTVLNLNLWSYRSCHFLSARYDGLRLPLHISRSERIAQEKEEVLSHIGKGRGRGAGVGEALFRTSTFTFTFTF